MTYSRRKRTTAALAVILSMAAVLNGCSGADSLATSCSDFMSKDAATQLTLATKWGAPNRDHIGAVEKIAGRGFNADLLRYCPAHPDVKLSDIQLRLTVGSP